MDIFLVAILVPIVLSGSPFESHVGCKIGVIRIDEFVETMRPEIEADRERWGLSVSYWEANVELLKDFVRDGARDATVLAGIKNYFGLSSEEMTAYFGDKW